jgi:hypothetical protein
MRNSSMAGFYLLFAVVFGGVGFGMFFFLMLPEILSGHFDMLFPGLIMLFAFGGVGVGMGVAFLNTIMCGIRSRRIVMLGTPGIGTFIDAHVGVTVNNTRYYKLTFSFRDNRGINHVVRTRSRYYGREIDILRNRGTFEIRYIDNHAVPTAEAFVRRGAPTQNAHVSAPTMVSCPLSVKNRKTCRYCGGESEMERSRCLFCGSSKFDIVQPPPRPTATPAHSHSHTPVRPTPTNFTPRKPMSAKTAKIIVAIVIVVMVAPFLLGFVGAIVGVVTTSVHRIGDTVRTDWFTMRVNAAWYVPDGVDGSLGGELAHTPIGHRRVFVDVTLNNFRRDYDLDMDLSADFFLRTRDDGEVRPINHGGSLDHFDQQALVGPIITSLGGQRLLVNTFMVSTGQSIRGIIAFDFPRYESFSYFVYEEWEYEEFPPYSPIRRIHLYKFRLY